MLIWVENNPIFRCKSFWSSILIGKFRIFVDDINASRQAAADLAFSQGSVFSKFFRKFWLLPLFSFKSIKLIFCALTNHYKIVFYQNFCKKNGVWKEAKNSGFEHFFDRVFFGARSSLIVTIKWRRSIFRIALGTISQKWLAQSRVWLTKTFATN